MLSMSDESSYLFLGVKLLSLGFPAASWGPLYALWYYLLSLFQPAPLELYFLSAALIAAGLPIALFLLALSLDIPLSVALLIALGFLTSMFNFPVYPKVTNFAFIFICLTLVAAKRLPSALAAFAVLALGALIAAYIRPEYSLALVIFLAIVLFLVIGRLAKRQRLGRIEALALALLFVSGVLFIFRFGIPIGDRSFVAFGQHFQINHANWKKTGPIPFGDWQSTTRHYFGKADSIWTAWLNAPGAVAKHIQTNVVNTPVRAIRPFIYNSLQAPARYNKLVRRLNALLLLGVTIYAVLGRRRWMAKAGVNWRDNRTIIIGLAVFSLPPLLSCLIIYPRFHYLVLLNLPLVLIIALFLTGKTVNEQWDTAICAILLCLLLIINPVISKQSEYGRRALRNNNMLTTMIAEMTSLAGGREANFLATGQFDSFLGANLKYVDVDSKEAVSFPLFIRARNIRLIVVNYNLKNSQAYKSDPSFSRFLDHPELFGFKRLTIENSRDYILYDQAFLKSRK
ncbi:MAG: hypothetical protein WC529_07300 [Candidatus Margulisiibacteriota bacterium]